MLWPLCPGKHHSVPRLIRNWESWRTGILWNQNKTQKVTKNYRPTLQSRFVKDLTLHRLPKAVVRGNVRWEAKEMERGRKQQNNCDFPFSLFYCHFISYDATPILLISLSQYIHNICSCCDCSRLVYQQIYPSLSHLCKS